MIGIFSSGIEAVSSLINDGGVVLFAIMGLSFFLFALVAERIAYFIFGHGSIVKSSRSVWDERSDRSNRSWRAVAVRDELISNVKSSATWTVPVIKVLVAVAPLFGLLGTVSGMIQVFVSMAVSGSSNAREMSGGVFQATIPTMAGMSVALIGLFLTNLIEWLGRRATVRFANSLEFDH